MLLRENFVFMIFYVYSFVCIYLLFLFKKIGGYFIKWLNEWIVCIIFNMIFIREVFGYGWVWSRDWNEKWSNDRGKIGINDIKVSSFIFIKLFLFRF